MNDMEDLYSKMGDELRSLFKDLFDLKRASQTREKMAKILATAHQIGGSIKDEADRLKEDVANFLKKPDEKHRAILKKHAMRLEQETREL